MSATNITHIDLEGRRQRRELDLLLVEARQAIVAAEAGDLGGVYLAHLALTRAVSLMLAHAWDAA